jgi:ribosomal protein S18 acetylase RimI-like enzyme
MDSREAPGPIIVDRLMALPREDVAPLLAESERAGLRLVRRLVDEWQSGANRFDRPGEALFAARLDREMIAVCGLNVDPYDGTDRRVGRVRHLYVLTSHRRLGIGERLVREVIAAARGRFDHLHLRTGNTAAARLYERVGFCRCAGVPDCTHVMALGGQ